MYKTPSDSFIKALEQVQEYKEPVVSEEVHVHGYGVVSHENAKKGLQHHLDQVKAHSEVGNHQMAVNHAEYAMHYARGIANYHTAGKLAKGEKL
jgi:hypothetical protein